METAEPAGSISETSETSGSGPAGVSYSFARLSTLSKPSLPSSRWISLCSLCVLCVSVVNSVVKTTTETQRTQRLHREELPNENRASRIRQFAMSQFDSNKDYYGVLGVDKDASRIEIERQYKREAAKHHPDRGGSEERMKSLNEAYGVLKDKDLRSSYDAGRQRPATPPGFVRVTTPTARDVGVLGHCLSAFLCVIAGLFLLLLVHAQWIWFLWPLAILALLVLGFGILLAHSAMVAVNQSLPVSNRLKRHTRLQEVGFWTVIVGSGYGLYLLMSY